MWASRSKEQTNMTTSSLAKKLQIKAGQHVSILNAPANYLAQLGPLPDVTLVDKASGAFDVVQLFVKNVAELNRMGPAAIRAVKPDGVLWISYPKLSAKTDSDITRDVGWDVVKKAGLRPVTQVSIDDTWSALRFRPVEQVKTRPRK
jgi:hypothetical protein